MYTEKQVSDTLFATVKRIDRIVFPKIQGKNILPPDEEKVKRLNELVKRRPFCVYYKEKTYDPL